MIAPDPAEEELKKTQIGIEGNTPMNLAKERTTASYNITHLNERRPDPETGEMKWRRRRMYGWWDKRKHWLNPEVHALQEDLPEKTPIADYDYESDKIVLTTQQCPTRKQNYDHAMFLIKVLFPGCFMGIRCFVFKLSRSSVLSRVLLTSCSLDLCFLVPLIFFV